MKNIIVVNSGRAIRISLKEFLEYESYNVEFEDNNDTAFKKICNGDCNVVISEIDASNMEGVLLLERIRKSNNKTPFLMIIKGLDIDTIVHIIKLENTHLIQSPINLGKLLQKLRELTSEVENIITPPNVSSENNIKLKSFASPDIIGDSIAMKNIFGILEKVSPTNERVLIYGENGTGKELIARRIHECSKRHNKPFVAVNCAAIPAELIESQLFGHEKGSFTSAIKMHKGNFEQANNGTLFLDEIGDMCLSAQSKILRVLQEKKITRVGGEVEIPIDVRIIAATNKNLREAIKKGDFREDLFHRLNVIPIKMPSLSERKEDIPLLVNHFLSKFKENYTGKEISINEEAMNALLEMPWTGNVRELENSIERLSILCNDVITKDDVDQYIGKQFL